MIHKGHHFTVRYSEHTLSTICYSNIDPFSQEPLTSVANQQKNYSPPRAESHPNQQIIIFPPHTYTYHVQTLAPTHFPLAPDNETSSDTHYIVAHRWIKTPDT